MAALTTRYPAARSVDRVVDGQRQIGERPAADTRAIGGEATAVIGQRLRMEWFSRIDD